MSAGATLGVFFWPGAACTEGVVGGGGRGASLDHLQQTRRSQSWGLASQLPIPFHGVPKIAVRHVVGGAWQACRLRYFCHPSTTKTIAHSTCSFCTSCSLSLVRSLSYTTRGRGPRASLWSRLFTLRCCLGYHSACAICRHSQSSRICGRAAASGPECMWHSSSGFCFCSALS